MNKKNNYVKLIIILLVTMILTFLVCNILKNIEKNKIKEGYLADYVYSINLKELENTLVEASNQSYIYISYSNDEDVYNMEKTLKKVIKNNNLEDNFIYVNVKNNKDDLAKVNKIFNMEDKINKLPCIVYVKNGVMEDYIDSSMQLITSADFQNLIDMYEVNINETNN